MDPARRPLIAANSLWYHIRCKRCKRHLGLLADVSPDPNYIGLHRLETEDAFKRRGTM